MCIDFSVQVEERLATRSVREANSHQHDETGEDPEVRRGQRSQVTARLRERFRIRTKPHGDPRCLANS